MRVSCGSTTNSRIDAKREAREQTDDANMQCDGETYSTENINNNKQQTTTTTGTYRHPDNYCYSLPVVVDMEKGVARTNLESTDDGH